MAAFHFEEPGHRRFKTERIGIGRVDSGHQRLRHALQHLASHTASYERGETFVTAGAASRNQRLQCHPQLTAQTEQRASENRKESRGGEQGESIGDLHQMPIPHDMSLAKSSPGSD